MNATTVKVGQTKYISVNVLIFGDGWPKREFYVNAHIVKYVRIKRRPTYYREVGAMRVRVCVHMCVYVLCVRACECACVRA